MANHQLGIDIGGTGIKAAIFDLDNGQLLGEKVKYKTPEPKDPEAIAKCISQLLEDFGWSGSVGCGFPAIIKNGVTASASNVHQSWLNFNAEKYFTEFLGRKTFIVNDADAAGLAEMQFGRGKNIMGTVLLLTVGTGIGSSIFTDGVLLKNSELGHMNFKGQIAERTLSRRAKDERGLSLEEWAQEFNGYLEKLDFLFSPQLFILGGGISKHFEKFNHCFNSKLSIVSASLLNNAGILGAALSVRPI